MNHLERRIYMRLLACVLRGECYRDELAVTAPFATFTALDTGDYELLRKAILEQKLLLEKSA